MPSRRQILQSGLIVSSAALLPLRSIGASSDPRPFDRIRPELFIYDERYPFAVNAAQQHQNKLRTASTREVFTRLWYDELDLRWRHAPMTLIGMTSPRGLHVLETLALDRRMRVMSRTLMIERVPAPGEFLIYWLIAPATLRRSA